MQEWWTVAQISIVWQKLASLRKYFVGEGPVPTQLTTAAILETHSVTFLLRPPSFFFHFKSLPAFPNFPGSLTTSSSDELVCYGGWSWDKEMVRQWDGETGGCWDGEMVRRLDVEMLRWWDGVLWGLKCWDGGMMRWWDGGSTRDKTQRPQHTTY